MKKNNIRGMLITISTILILTVLFGVIFIRLGLARPSETFFMEIAIISGFVTYIKLFWHSYVEALANKDEGIVKLKRTYDDLVEKEIIDIYDFEIFLPTLDQENYDAYVEKALKGKTPENYNGKFLKIFPRNYNKLYNKLVKRAHKRVRKIKSIEVRSRCTSKDLANSKNYLKMTKTIYLVVTGIVSILASILFASIMYQELLLNISNIFRYVSYLAIIAITIGTTIKTAWSMTIDLTTDFLVRLEHIINKYVQYKKRGGVVNGINNI